MMIKLTDLTSSIAKISLLVAIVGFSVYGAGFGQFFTGAFFSSTITAAGNVLGVDDIEEPCQGGQVWLAEVVSSTQGLRKNGTPITDANRTDPTKALGPNDATTTSNFFALGNDGVLVSKFAVPVEDGAGNDFSIYETTNGRATYPIETASVEVSQDGVNWVLFPTAASSRPTGTSSFDLTTIGVPWFQYIRITDTTNFAPHAADADGFDVDAVSANYGTCDNDLDQGRTISGLKFRDQNQNQTNDGEQGLQGWTMYAATHLADLTVQGTSTPPVSTPVLANGTTYLIRVSGTYFANDGIYADAKYSERNSSGSWTDAVQNYEGYGTTLLDLQIDGSSPNWGSYNSSHTYWIPVTGAGVSKSLELYDLDNGNNNSGSLSVSIYQVIASDVTDSSGNYSLDVPLMGSTIYIFEGMQDGWSQTLPGPANFYYTTTNIDGDISRSFGNVTNAPVGNVQFTKYVCAQDETITNAQRPDTNGNFVVPDDCELQSGAQFGYIHQADKTDLSAPYLGLSPDTTPFTPLAGATDSNGVLVTSLMPSAGRYMLAELDGGGQKIDDGNLLGFLCLGDGGIFTNNYEATFVPENGTTYCAVFNRDPDTSIVLNEFLPDPQGADDAAIPQGEWVELYNNSAFDIDVNGWVLYNSSNTSALTISTSNSDNDGNPFDSGETIVPSGGYLTVYRDGSSAFSLDENGDTVRLYNAPLATGDLIDSYMYDTLVAEEKTLARMPDGTGSWVDPIAQPGRENADELSDLDPFVKVWQQDSNHAIIGLFEGLNHSTADYTLTYTRNTTTTPVQEQLAGSVTIDNNNKYVFDIYLGTQSGDSQTPHTDISNVHLSVLFHDNGMPTRQADLEGSWTP
jgi:hypothetical protein